MGAIGHSSVLKIANAKDLIPGGSNTDSAGNPLTHSGRALSSLPPSGKQQLRAEPGGLLGTLIQSTNNPATANSFNPVVVNQQ